MRARSAQLSSASGGMKPAPNLYSYHCGPVSEFYAQTPNRCSGQGPYRIHSNCIGGCAVHVTVRFHCARDATLAPLLAVSTIIRRRALFWSCWRVNEI